MSYYSVKPIQLSLRPSYVLAWTIGLASLLSCVILVGLPIHSVIKVTGILLTVSAAAYSIQRYALIVLARSIIHVSLNHESKLQLTCKDGSKHEVHVLESSFVAAYLTVLNLQCVENGRRIHLVLLPDNVEADNFRQLRVWLRWGREKPEGMAGLT